MLVVASPSAAVAPTLPFLRPAFQRHQTEPFNLGRHTPTARARFGADATPRTPTFAPTFGGAPATPPRTPVASPSPAARELRRAATHVHQRAASRSTSRTPAHSRASTPAPAGYSAAVLTPSARSRSITPPRPRARADTEWAAGVCNMADVVAKAGKAKRILCYGDSLTAGFYNGGSSFEPYGHTLSQELRSMGDMCNVDVVGLSGKTASECVQGLNSPAITDCTGRAGKGLSRKLAEEGPFDLVIIMLGTNDLGQGQAPQTILKSVSQMHAACHRMNIPTLAVAPPTVDQGQPRAGRQQLAQLLASWAQATKGVAAYVDCEEFCPRHERQLWEPDQLHLSRVGSQAFGRRMARWLVKMARSNALKFH
mmetsp:Transcript_45692/g.83684  ORF Transcript_45692/g.83684 Transcript_45692/m.83684 type:complete len:368 (+) Transcript_45692:71-1174(+)